MLLSVVMELDQYKPIAADGCLLLHRSGYCDVLDGNECTNIASSPCSYTVEPDARVLPNRGYVLPGCSQPPPNGWVTEINRY